MQFIKKETSKKSKLLLTSSVLMLNGNMWCTQSKLSRSNKNFKQYADEIPTIDTSKIDVNSILSEATSAYKTLKYYLQALQEALPKDNVPSNKHLNDSLDTLKYYLQKVEKGLLKDNMSSKKDVQELYNTLKDYLQKVEKYSSKDNMSSREDLTALYNTIIDRLQKEKATLSIDNDEGYGSDAEEDNAEYEIGYKVKPIYEKIHDGMINRSKNKKQQYSNDTKAHYDQGYYSDSNTTSHYKDLKDDGQKSDNDNDNNGHIYETIAPTEINGCKKGQESNDFQDQSNVCDLINSHIYDSVYEPTDKRYEDDASSNTSNIYEPIDERPNPVANTKEATKCIQIMKNLAVDVNIVHQCAPDIASCDLIDKVK